MSSTRAPRKDLFPAEYLKDLNATKAAGRCGYSRKTAASQGARLLRDVKVKAAIAKLQLERAARVEVTSDRILEEVDTLALGEIGDVLDFSGDKIRLRTANQISARGRRLLSSLKVRRYLEKGLGDREVEIIEFKLWDKTAALRLAMQHRGMLLERTLGVPLDQLTEAELERVIAGEDPLRVLADSRRG